MFIRRAKIRTTERGDVYYSYRLVRNERSGDRVRQHTLLNLAATSRSSDGTGPCCAPGSSSCSSARANWCRCPVRKRWSGMPSASPRNSSIAHRPPQSSAPTCRRGCEFPGVDPPALGRRRECRAVGHGAARPGGSAGAARLQRHATRAGHGHHHRAHGGTGLGARQLALAVRAFGPRRVAGRGLRADEHDAPLPGLRCPAGAARGDRGPPVRAGGGPVRLAPNGHAVRPDQHLLRG